jgi:predicted DNA-binding protein
MRRSVEVLSLRIPRRVAARLSRAAKRTGRTKTEIVLSAVEKELEREGEIPDGSFLDVAQDLVACINGPGDLSASKKHLRGFGRS